VCPGVLNVVYDKFTRTGCRSFNLNFTANFKLNI
jgi:hypothetical protein